MWSWFYLIFLDLSSSLYDIFRLLSLGVTELAQGVEIGMERIGNGKRVFGFVYVNHIVIAK